jgi:hypothetical protein
MAGVFQDVHLEWKGKRYTIPSNKMMGAIARIEQHVTLKELYVAAADRGTLKLGTLAAAYGSVLRYAGAAVDDEDVYSGMFQDGAQDAIIGALEGLMAMMIPPSATAAKPGGDVKPGNPNRRARRAAASLSRKRTK